MRLCIFLLLVAALMLAPRQASTRSVLGEYAVISLGTLGGERSTPWRINNRGVVVGRAQTATGESHAFVWKAGQMRDLGTLPGGNYSAAYDINHRGEIVGESEDAEGHPRAVLWDRYGLLDLGTFNGTESWALAISDNGQITGAAEDGLDPFGDRRYWGFRGERWSGSVPQDRGVDLVRLAPPPVAADELAYGTEGVAFGANGSIIGTVLVDAEWGGAYWPAEWRNHYVRVLPHGDYDLFPSAANSHSQVVGTGYSEGGGHVDGWTWRAGRMRSGARILPSPASAPRGDWAMDALSINNRGAIVGQVYQQHDSGRGGFIIDRQSRLLTDLLPPRSDWRVFSANSINDRGEIVGNGSFHGGPPVAILLRPIGSARH